MNISVLLILENYALVVNNDWQMLSFFLFVINQLMRAKNYNTSHPNSTAENHTFSHRNINYLNNSFNSKEFSILRNGPEDTPFVKKKTYVPEV